MFTESRWRQRRGLHERGRVALRSIPAAHGDLAKTRSPGERAADGNRYGSVSCVPGDDQLRFLRMCRQHASNSVVLLPLFRDTCSKPFANSHFGYETCSINVKSNCREFIVMYTPMLSCCVYTASFYLKRWLFVTNI